MTNDNRQNVMAVESIAAPRSRSLFSYLGEGYWSIFGRLWPAWLGGLLLGLTNFARRLEKQRVRPISPLR